MAQKAGKAEVERATAFLQDVQYYVGDTSTLIAGRAKWRRPKKSESAKFFGNPIEKIAYFDRAASSPFSLFSSAPLPLEIPLDSPQEESLLPPSWPEEQQEDEPINVGFRMATSPALKQRQQYELQVRKLLWDLNVPIIPHIASVEVEGGSRINLLYLPASKTETYREIYYSHGKPLAGDQLDDFLEDLIDAMKLVENVHRHKLLLRSIRPDIFARYFSQGVKKLVFGGTDGLIRLGTAVFGGIISEGASDSWLVEECAPYLAPELLGRSSKKVSYASDIYSFGITMYELLTGHLPLTGTDFLHKIQAILALEPPPLLSLAPHLPLELVEIVTKMIQKDPAERYVSIRSCRYDIEQLQKLRRETKPFVVGETDQFARLRFPDHLIGMDEQISVIKASYRQAAFGEHCALSIRGASGTGKTSLAMQTITSCGAPVFYGKYDLAENNTFLAPIKTILNSLLIPLVSLPEEELDLWRQQLLEAIQEPLVPFFLLFLDESLRQSLQLIKGSELKRLHPKAREFLPPSFRSATYASIIRVIALFTERNGQEPSRMRYKPLVLFVDDIQWATPDDLVFYEQLAQPFQAGGILAILAFRDNDGSQSFLESSFRENLCTLRYNVETAYLDQSDVLQLLSRVLLKEAEEPTGKVRQLSEVIHQQTLGNGNHIRNLLSDLHSSEVLFFDWDQLEWAWHYGSDSRSRPSTTLGAAEVLETELRAGTERGKTADTFRNVIFAAAALASHGGSFSCRLVAVATQSAYQDVLGMIKSLADNSRIFTCLGTAALGLRTPTSALIESQEKSLVDKWAFVHDSVQQAASALFTDGGRTQRHQTIGERLLESSEKEDPLVAEIALYNLNEAYLRGHRVSIVNADELISLNLLSAQNALHSGGSEIASRHADLAYRIWQDTRKGIGSPPLAVLLTLTDCCTFRGDYERAAAHGEAAIAAANGQDEKLQAAYSHVKAILNANDNTALALLYRYLRSFADIDVTPNEQRKAWLVDWLRQWTPPQGKFILSEDKLHISKTTLVNSGIALAFTTDPISGVHYICESAYLNLHTSTFTSHTALAITVIVLFFNGLGEYAVAQKFTKFSKALLPMLPCTPHQLVEAEAGFAANWYEDESQAVMGARLADIGHKAAAIGHSEFAAYSFGTGGYILLLAGTRNPVQDSEVIASLCQLVTPGVAIFAQRPVDAACLLSSPAPNVKDLETPDDPEAQNMHTQQYHCIKLWFALILDQIDAGTFLASLSAKDVAPGNSPWQSLRFLYTLVAYDLARVSGLPDVKTYTQMAASFVDTWERTSSTLPLCPNFSAFLFLMKAARDEYFGRFQSSLENLDSAIDEMAQMPTLLLAHANERAGRIIYRLSGSKRAAAPYLGAARSVYQLWNVPSKVTNLSQHLSQVANVMRPHLSDPSKSVPVPAPAGPSPVVPIAKSSGTRSSSSGSDGNALTDLVDLSSLVAVVTTWQTAKSTQAVSRGLIEILLSSLGCRYGALALRQKDKVFRLIACGDGNRINTDLNPSIEGAGLHAPAAIMMHVARLRQPLVDIAMIESNPVLRDDPFVKEHHPRSVIALPIQEGTNFCAIVYLDCVRDNAFASSKTSEIISLLTLGAVTAIARIELLDELDREKANLENTVRSRSATAEALAARASHAQQAQSRFLLTMSHELRSPLNSVILLSDLLLEANLEPVLLDYVKTIKQGFVIQSPLMSTNRRCFRESSNDLLSVIRDILDYSRLESYEVHLEKKPVDIVNLLDRTLDQLSETAASKAIELVNVTALDLSTPWLVIADATRVKQCLLNLVGNALKFTPNGGAVSVTATSELLNGHDHATARLRLQFAVADNGIGVAPQKQALLFRSFSQVDDSITRLYGGSGLGLAIVRQLANLMSGDAWCVSEPGKGSTFFFSFEAEVAQTDKSSLAADSSLAKDVFDGKRVLIVSPTALLETRKVLHRDFTFLGFKIDMCTEEEMATQEPVNIDLLVLVAVGPSGPNVDCIKRVGVYSPQARFIILSHRKQQNEAILAQPTHLTAATETLLLPIKHRQLQTSLSRLFQLPCPKSLDIEKPKQSAPAVLPIPRLADECPFTVLCVDDNAVNIKVLGQLLRRLGYEQVGIARDGQEAIEACRARAFDLVLMDLQMPKCDGNTAMRTIKLEQPDGPLIVAVTAHAPSGAKEAALASGFDAYISKPIILQTLLSVFREMHSKRLQANGEQVKS